jgi:membrane protease YdiL (CAAX protease family)
VLYLLARSGEGPAAIGLGGQRLRMDLALVMIVWLFVQLIPQSIGGGLVYGLGLPVYRTASTGSLAFIAVDLVASVVAGVVEEIVVLGYLVRRLEQRGVTTRAIVMIAVAVRVSYHLYYGGGALQIAVWATASVLLYLKIRRLLPFIICHIMWDVGVSLGMHSPATQVTLFALFLVLSIVLYVRWRNWHPDPVPIVGSSGLSWRP